MCIFVAFILVLAALDIYSIAQSKIEIDNTYFKLLYIIILALTVAGYSVIKENLSKRNVNKRKNAFIRYTFIIAVILGIKVISYAFFTENIKATVFIFYTIMCILNSVLLKKIIYNISKSDVLSVIGMLMYTLLPNTFESFRYGLFSYMIVALILGIIMIIQKIIDELKQIGIKNIKYILLSVILGALIAISMILGINVLVFIVVGFLSIICTSNLDKTHINFPNKFINMLRQKSKELLYRFERIYINKIFITIAITALVATLMYLLLSHVVFDKESFTDMFKVVRITNNIKVSFSSILDKNYVDILTNLKVLVSNTKLFTLVLIVYIIFIEFLNVVLRRKYDTKSTIIKSMFVCCVLAYSVFGQSYMIYTQALQVFLILIAIINTSNLYLNREERIKLLNAN